jgi:muramoyltetrapeptide carboxypeptidase
MIKPERLKKGDMVGLITTSYPVSQQIIDKSVKYFEDLGLRVKVSKHAADSIGYMAGTPEDRANDLMDMFLDPNIKAIFINGGGRNACQLLPLLDYHKIKRNPKIFMALSNPSIIANAITAKTDIITFHGPTGYLFGEAGITEFTEQCMKEVIIDGKLIGKVKNISNVELLKKGGIAKGKLFGGHLLTNRALIGTEYAPDWHNVILFLEDCFEELHDFDDHLMHFKLAGIFDKISGLVIGRPEGVEEKLYPSTKETMQDIILRICRGYSFPILYGLDIGHTNDKVTLPIGAIAEIDQSNSSLIITEKVIS